MFILKQVLVLHGNAPTK